MSVIETDRLIVRTFAPDDVTAWLAIVTQPEVRQYLPLATAPTLELVRAGVERQVDEQQREGFSSWAILRKSDDALIGRCGLHRLPEGYVEIAWIFDPAVWGQGYATEAATAGLNYGFTTVGLSKIYALIDPRNAGSMAVAYRVGMQFDRLVRAYRRDLLRYVRHA